MGAFLFVYLHRQYCHIHKYIHTMFILRQISKCSGISNMSLGNRYSIIRKQEGERFEHLLKNQVTHPDKEEVFAFILYNQSDDNEGCYPLYKKQQYYVMTESGRTFEGIKTSYEYEQ